MINVPEAISEQTADVCTGLLEVLRRALEGPGISALLVRTVGLVLRFPEIGLPQHRPPELEMRGADGRVRATITVVADADGFAYLVHLARIASPLLFPVSDPAQALAYLVAEARDWNTCRCG